MPKPFSLELAHRKNPIATRSGKPVRIICCNRKTGTSSDSNLVVLVESEPNYERPRLYAPDGKWSTGPEDSNEDLVLLPVGRTYDGREYYIGDLVWLQFSQHRWERIEVTSAIKRRPVYSRRPDMDVTGWRAKSSSWDIPL